MREVATKILMKINLKSIIPYNYNNYSKDIMNLL